MESHYLLSNDQREYLTSQNPKITNKSEQRRRITEKVAQSFGAFDQILKSPYISQKYKDELFAEPIVKNFLINFARYDHENLREEEANKQEICKTMVTIGLDYFKSRYKKMKIIDKNIAQATELLNLISILSHEAIYDDEVMKMYKARQRTVRPQLLIAEKDFWMAECKHCYNYSSNAKTEKDAIKNLKHTKHCLYTIDMKKHGGTQRDSIIQQYIIRYEPRDKV